MKIIGIIPARYDSSRFPGKPLAMISGKPMIQHVFENASKAKKLDEVIVATDDERIYDAVIAFGGKVSMTSKKHPSGSDRCQEVLQQLAARQQIFEVAINIQGDEPFLNPDQIDMLVQSFEEDAKTEISTLIKKIDESDELFNPNVVKVVIGHQQEALYFSRSPIPFLRDVDQKKWTEENDFYKHIGIYGFKTNILDEISSLEKSKLEKSENLEQLRWIENGYQIKTRITEIENISIDRPEDLKKIVNNI